MKLANVPLPADATIDRAVALISMGRIFPYGVPSWIAPTLSARVLGAGASSRDPHVRYLMRIFGIRAIALGASYLLTDGESRRRSQRLALVVDTADTVMVPFCGLHRRVVLRSLAITGPYAAVGWLRLVKDVQKRRIEQM